MNQRRCWRGMRGVVYLLALLLVICQLTVKTEATPSVHPMLCISTSDLDNVVDEMEDVFIGIPINDGEACYILAENIGTPQEDLYYLGAAGKMDGSDPFLMTYQGNIGGLSLYSADTDNSTYFYSFGNAPTEGATYIMVGINSDADVIETTVTVTEVSGEESSSGLYGVSLSGDARDILPPAAITSGGRLIAVWTGDSAFSFQPASNNGSGGSGGDSGGKKDEGDPDSDSPDTGVRRNSKGFQRETVALVIGTVVILIGIVAAILKRKKKASPDIQPQPQPEPKFNFGRDLISPTLPLDPGKPASKSEPNQPQTVPVELFLQASGGSLDGFQYPIPDTGLLIGRAAEANVRFAADTKGVSRNHCRVFWHNGAIQVMDLGSTSGTFLSGHGKLAPNTPIPLKEGSVIYLGSKAVSLRLGSRLRGGA